MAILSQFHGIAVNAADIQHRYDVNGVGLDQSAWILAAREIGLKAKVSSQKLERLHMAALPALVWREDGEHLILAKMDEERYLIQDLQQGRPVILSKEEFVGRYWACPEFCVSTCLIYPVKEHWKGIYYGRS